MTRMPAGVGGASLVALGHHHPGVVGAPVEIDGVPISFGLVDGPAVDFDGSLPMFRDHVLVRVDAFSCNYRDKALLLSFAERVNAAPRSKKFKGFGSEFAGEVVAVGDAVSAFSPGDRVMPDATFPDSGVSGLLPGIVTNTSSMRWGVFHAAKLCRVPEWLSTTEASAFSLAAHTAHSMVRRAGVDRGGAAVVASARSNTSLAIMKVLAAKGVRVVAVSSSPWSDQEKKKLGLEGDISFVELQGQALSQEIKGVDAVLDPFADLHYSALSRGLKAGGRYVTCGFKNQHAANRDPDEVIPTFYGVLADLIVNNHEFVGNCIGLKSDLEDVCRLGEAMKIPLDSVWGPADVGAFISRTFNERKLGKVVLDYSR